MFKKAILSALICLISLSACTTTEVVKNSKDTSSAIVDAPVKALNLKKRKIPNYLSNVSNPYVDGQAGSCDSIKEEISKLTEFLGPDWDSDDHYSKVGRTDGGFFDAVLPYGGLVRFASGASKHQKKLLKAVDYATVRRAYLKTLRSNKGCEVETAP